MIDMNFSCQLSAFTKFLYAYLTTPLPWEDHPNRNNIPITFYESVRKFKWVDSAIHGFVGQMVRSGKNLCEVVVAVAMNNLQYHLHSVEKEALSHFLTQTLIISAHGDSVLCTAFYFSS